LFALFSHNCKFRCIFYETPTPARLQSPIPDLAFLAPFIPHTYITGPIQNNKKYQVGRNTARISNIISLCPTFLLCGCGALFIHTENAREQSTEESAWTSKRGSNRMMVIATCFHDHFLLDLFFDHEDGGHISFKKSQKIELFKLHTFRLIKFGSHCFIFVIPFCEQCVATPRFDSRAAGIFS
jgi:hypothetical protein